MATSKTPAKKGKKQDIEELKKRFNDLNTRKIQAETKLKTAKRELAKLRKKAKEEYGTDDLDELQTKLNELRDENEQKRSKYQASLEQIEEKLDEIEEKHGPLEEVEAAEDENE